MKAMNACVIDDEEAIDPPERELTPEEEEWVAFEWYYGLATPFRRREKKISDCPEPVTCALELEEDFEALCDAAFSNN